MAIELKKLARSCSLPLAVRPIYTESQISGGFGFHESGGRSPGRLGVSNAIVSSTVMRRPSASAQTLPNSASWSQAGLGELVRLQINRRVLILRLSESMILPCSSEVGL